MSKLILAMVDIFKKPGFPSTFCIKPSAELLSAISNVRKSISQLNSELSGVLISFNWRDEGVWIEEKIAEVEGMDYESIVEQCSIYEVSDFRIEVGKKGITFYAEYQDEDIFSHQLFVGSDFLLEQEGC